MTAGSITPEALVGELEAERGAVFELLERIEARSMTTPGLIGDWSARDLIAHLGYWAGHATEVIHEVEQGRTEEIGVGAPSVDEVNATVMRVARQTDLDTVRRREKASVEALVGRLRDMDPAALAVTLPDGATLAQGIREDAAEHYREHADELRRALGQAPSD